MDFTKISGYEFEDFIANFFRQKGFKVTQTDYSNDGGVDLIAEFEKPIFSGKYIIQCKKYTDNLVGQPVVRDLYGVVMSENANKGILITTSDFTEQAKNFANGKNIELINGLTLDSLINDTALKEIQKETTPKFYEISGFDRGKYELLKKRIKVAKKNRERYYELICFLKSYITDKNVEVVKSGLIDELLNVYNETKVYLDDAELDYCMPWDLIKLKNNLTLDYVLANYCIPFSYYTDLHFYLEKYFYLEKLKLSDGLEPWLNEPYCSYKVNSPKGNYYSSIYLHQIDAFYTLRHAVEKWQQDIFVPANNKSFYMYAFFKYYNCDKGCEILKSSIVKSASVADYPFPYDAFENFYQDLVLESGDYVEDLKELADKYKEYLLIWLKDQKNSIQEFLSGGLDSRIISRYDDLYFWYKQLCNKSDTEVAKELDEKINIRFPDTQVFSISNNNCLKNAKCVIEEMCKNRITKVLFAIKKIIIKKKTHTQRVASCLLQLVVLKSLKNAFHSLTIGNWESAKEYSDYIASSKAENLYGIVYVIRLMAEFKIHSKEEFSKLRCNIEENINFKQAMFWGDSELKNELCGYAKEISQSIELDHKNQVYIEACNKKNLYTIESNKMALDLLEELGDFRDTRKLIIDCKQNIKKLELDLQQKQEQDAEQKRIKFIEELHIKDLEKCVTSLIGNMVECKAGCFNMGSIPPKGIWRFLGGRPESGRNKDEIYHQVTISYTFYMSKYPVTQAQYVAIMDNNPSRFKGDNKPVTNVTWFDAKKFCDKLNEIASSIGLMNTYEEYRFFLPTEAQWEYACRADTITSLNSGKNITSNKSCINLDEVGWYFNNSNNKLHSIGEKNPNKWGIYDMHGNVWEWCSDWYGGYSLDAVDPIGPQNGDARVCRGGSYCCAPYSCRSENRDYHDAYFQADDLGFRVVLVQKILKF